MDYDQQALVARLMQNKRIKTQVRKLKLTDEQILEALPILIDMSKQKDDRDTKYLTSFYIDDNNQVRRSEQRSTYWMQFAYLENIKTLAFEHVDFEDEKEFIKESSRKRVVNKIKDYIDKNKRTKGLYLHGAIGVGKTFLMKRIAKKIAIHDNEVAFLTVSNLVSKIKPMFREKDDDSYINLVTILKRIDYLFLDDIGSEQIRDWFRDGVLFPILDERMEKEKTTFFASNYTQAKLEQIEAKTSGSKYLEKGKSAKLLSRIRALSDEMSISNFNEAKISSKSQYSSG